jgi:hypothetical protein
MSRDPLEALQEHYAGLAAEGAPSVERLIPMRQRVPLLVFAPFAAAAAGYLFLLLCSRAPAAELPGLSPITEKQMAMAKLEEPKAPASPRSHLWRKRPLG